MLSAEGANVIEAAIFIVFPFAMAYAAVSDMLSMTIANRVSVILVVAFAILAPFTDMALTMVGMHLAAGLAMLLITFGMFSVGAMGGGDAKLIAATSVWMGFSISLFHYLVVASFVGGLLTLFIIAYRKSPMSAYVGHIDFMHRLARKDVGIPYGIALGIAGVVVYPQTPLMAWAMASLTGL